MAHVHITNDRDHKVFVFIRDRLNETVAFVNAAESEKDEIQFAPTLDGVKLEARPRQYWPPHDAPDGNLVGIVDIYMTAVDGEAKTPPAPVPTSADSPRPTSHEDLLAVYYTRASEHGCGFLLAGEIDEAAHVLVNGEPALSKGVFKLLLPMDPEGHVALRWRGCHLGRFGCGVFYYVAEDCRPPLGSVALQALHKAVEAAFIELLDGAVPAS